MAQAQNAQSVALQLEKVRDKLSLLYARKERARKRSRSVLHRREDDGAQTVFPIYGTSGGISAAYIFYSVTGFQVWNGSPRSGAFINNLAIPTG
jgi:hypothetical protein